MVRQPKWDKFEAALLIETYWNIRNRKISRKEAAASLSKLLRDRMPENEIDETYRNENGINMRLGEIDALFNDKCYVWRIFFPGILSRQRTLVCSYSRANC